MKAIFKKQSISKIPTKDVIVTAINVLDDAVPQNSIHEIIKNLYSYLLVDLLQVELEELQNQAKFIIQQESKQFQLTNSTNQAQNNMCNEERQTNDFHQKQHDIEQSDKKRIKQDKILQKQKQNENMLEDGEYTLEQPGKQKISYIRPTLPSLNYNRMQFGDKLTRQIITMKVKAFKQNKKHYYLIRNEDVYINLEDESVIKLKATMDCAAPYLKPKFQQKFKHLDQQKQHKQNPQVQKLNLQTEKLNSQSKNEIKINQNKKNIQKPIQKKQEGLKPLKKQMVKIDYYFGQSNNEKQPYQKEQSNLQKVFNDTVGQAQQNQGQDFTSKNVRETFQLTKRLCLFKECVVNLEDLKGTENLDDPEWLNRNFNFPDHCKYDQYAFQGNRSAYLQKIIQAIDVAKCYLQHGYGLKIYRKYMPNGKTISKQNYSTYVWFCMKMVFRQLQHYLIVDCKKPIQPLTFSELSLVSIPLFRARQDLTQMQQDMWFKLVSAVYRINVVGYLTKNELFTIYNAIRRKLAERRDAIQFKLANTIQNQVHMTIKYYSYSEDGEVQFFGHDDGIQTITDIFDPLGRVQGIQHKKRWSQQFQLQFIKLYMQYKKLAEVKNNLLIKFTDQWYKEQFKLKHSLNSRFQRALKRGVQFAQYDFKKYCTVTKVTQINFYQKKFLTLNQAQLRVMAFNQFALQTRLMIFDYYLNNLYGKNKDIMNQHNIVYRITYLNYVIQSVAQVLQSKKSLVDVMNNSQEERLKIFELKNVKERRSKGHNQTVVQEENDDINMIVGQFLKQVKKKNELRVKIQEGSKKKRKKSKPKIKNQINQKLKKQAGEDGLDYYQKIKQERMSQVKSR